MSDAEASVATKFGRTGYLERGSGRPIVMIHGVGLHCGVWRPQVDALARSNRVIAYDTHGHGLSQHPPAGATLEVYIEQLDSLMDALTVHSAVLVGHSMGAMIATAYAATHPRRVEGLVAFNTVFRRTPEQRAGVESRADLLDAEGPAGMVDTAIARWFGAGLDEEDLRKAQMLREWLLAADPAGYAAAYRVFATSDDVFAPRLGRLEAPALFATGEFDPHSTPAMSAALADACPNAKARILRGERHMTTFKTPSLANAVIADFLENLADCEENEARKI